MKKNVLQLIGSFHQGGSERQALQLARLLREEKSFNVFLATLNKQGVLLEEAQKTGFENIAEFPLTSFYDFNFLKQVKKCRTFLRESKIEIIHTHDFYTNVFGMSAATVSGVALKIASKRETGGMRSKAQAAIEKIAFNRADLVTVNSKAVENYLSGKGVSAQKIRVIYNGLDLDRLTPEVSDRKLICENLGLPCEENIKFITLVANLKHAVKNQAMFLRAAKIVSEKCPEARFVLAGEGELKNGLENLAKDFNIGGKTHFIGRCANVPELLAVSFAGVLTSIAEGFSNSILEYMAAKLPVIATNVGGASEAIFEGESGFLVESNDAKALAEKLIFLLENPQKASEMGEKGRRIIEETFSCESQLRRTLEIYRGN